MITVITGATGSGKTWLMVQLMRRYWRTGDNVYVNFPVCFDKERTGEGVCRWHSLSEIYAIKRAVIGIDEGQKLFDARQWKRLPVSFAEKIAQHRHHFLDIITTTQDLLHIDFRIRSNVHVVYSCASIFRIPGNERVYPALQLIKITRQERSTNETKNRVLWLTKGRAKYYWLSRFWTKRYYDTYTEVDMDKFLCRIKYIKKPGQKRGKWIGRIYSRDLVNSGKARL